MNDNYLLQAHNDARTKEAEWKKWAKLSFFYLVYYLFNLFLYEKWYTPSDV